jgi:hypothetical protein
MFLQYLHMQWDLEPDYIHQDIYQAKNPQSHVDKKWPKSHIPAKGSKRARHKKGTRFTPRHPHRVRVCIVRSSFHLVGKTIDPGLLFFVS